MAANTTGRYQGHQARIASNESGRQRHATLAHRDHGSIDVGKSQLELSISAGPTQTYTNDPEGIAALTLELARQPKPSP